jgi:regulator of sirC expression with transglutaminase-like and TPR domain
VAVIERLLEMDPKALPEVRDLGVALAKLGRWEEATVRLEQYLNTQPDCPDAPRIEDLLVRIRRKGAENTGAENG